MSGSELSPQELTHSREWGPDIIWTCGVIYGLPASISPKLPVTHSGWRLSLGVVSWSLHDFMLSYLTNEKLRLLELWSFVQGEIATRGQSQWCV